MERKGGIDQAKQIMGKNFIGPDELLLIADEIGIIVPTNYPSIPFSYEELISKKQDYILILGVTQIGGGEPLTITSLRTRFGINPDLSEPCFYNQDWYLNEIFTYTCKIDLKWYLMGKRIVEESRGLNPDVLLNKSDLNKTFPTALLTTYTFFCWYFHSKGEFLWMHNYIWCSDTDHNEDRIYVGRYRDKDQVNKNGFSIHRHLKLSDIYGSILTF